MSFPFKKYTYLDTYMAALTMRYPGEQFSLFPDTLEVNWDNVQSFPKPTVQDMQQYIQDNRAALALGLCRNQRTIFLKSSDIYALPDYPHVSEQKRNEWLSYRQALRDLPTAMAPSLDSNDVFDVTSVTWPTPPS